MTYNIWSVTNAFSTLSRHTISELRKRTGEKSVRAKSRRRRKSNLSLSLFHPLPFTRLYLLATLASQSMNYSQGLPTSSAPRPAHRDVPSPFLSSPFAAPRTPLQPSDLYGARLRANLDNVKRELGEMRTDLEGVMQIKDELDSVRRELALIKELVRAQGTQALGS